MIEAYLDESGIHDKSEFCVIAGYIGGRGQIKKLERAWKEVLAEYHFPMAEFHAKDLIKSSKYRPMLARLASVAGGHAKIHPVSYGLVVRDFNSFSLKQRRFLTGATLDHRSKRLVSTGCPSKPYFVPFQNVVKLVTDFAPVGSKAHFHFGIDRTFAEYAKALFHQILKQPARAHRPWSSWKSRDRLGGVLFPRASETAPLQAADLLVHLTYLHLLECTANQRFHEPNGLLQKCLLNLRTREDHQYQDRKSLESVLEQTRKYAPGWDS